MTSDQLERKTAERGRLLAARRAVPAAERAADAAALAAGVLDAVARFDIAPGGTVCAYLAVGAEPGSIALLDVLRSAGYRVLLPIVVGAAPLDWAAYTGEHALRPGPHGLREPTGEPLGPLALASAALVLVPALAVDRRGTRIGKGGGHYDRSLPVVDAPLVAVVRDVELVDDLPVEPHDVRMTAVLTPSGLHVV
ncbi:5-formyltetrahydrofolate cyclo-ligase [Umezawaea endophytica]|uniref:5-formyltetrahydrofolate cyclo-ligase n=1 Tax=Umezawaea endophytica TaxID=1654476 RepID=A0A9X3AGR2_9PSEU|nr:5-formyltetrahydrofolate cyclo-ligase [Umezawaea endophytica]MCS7479956.1 5-formyltetrahydrofolate cyclo-ligase [Umezawaea endophytica]